MICPFSKAANLKGTTCRETCALWREVVKGVGECAIQTMATRLVEISLAIEELNTPPVQVENVGPMGSDE